MNNGHIKKKLIKLTAGILIGTTLTIGPSIAMSEVSHSDNSTPTQVLKLEEMLGSDSEFRYDSGKRLKYNTNEPVYICISEEFNTEQKQIIINTLDTVFGYVAQVNDNYKYEIVEDLDNIKYFNKTKISFEFSDLDKNTGGIANIGNDMFIFSSKGNFINYGKIQIDRNTTTGFKFMILHELLHCFGFKDLYDSDTEYFGDWINFQNLITPNAYNSLLAMYAQDLSKLSETERKEQINNLQQKSNEYKQFYYSTCSKRIKQLEQNYGIDKKSSSITGDIDILFNNVSLSNNIITSLRIKTKDNKYTIATYSGNKLIEKVSGDCQNINGVIYLENVKLNNFYENKKTHTDLQIIFNETTQEFEFNCLHSIFFKQSGKGYQYNLTQEASLQQ